MKKIIRLTENDLTKLVKRVINETRLKNQEEIDYILDKINREGMSSLTKSEKMMLSNSDIENYDTKDEIITLITDKIGECGVITTGELNLDSDILLKDSSDGIHLINQFFYEGVNVVVYGGYKNQTEIDEYELPYEKIDIDILEEILSVIEDYECE